MMLCILIPHTLYALKNYRVLSRILLQPLHIYITYSTVYTAVSLLSTKKWNVCFAFATYVYMWCCVGGCAGPLYRLLVGSPAQNEKAQLIITTAAEIDGDEFCPRRSTLLNEINNEIDLNL